MTQDYFITGLGSEMKTVRVSSDNIGRLEKNLVVAQLPFCGMLCRQLTLNVTHHAALPVAKQMLDDTSEMAIPPSFIFHPADLNTSFSLF